MNTEKRDGVAKGDALIIFDLDGTLYNTETTVIPSVKRALDELDIPLVSEDKIVRLVGHKTPTYCEKLLPPEHLDKKEEFMELLGQYEKKFIPSKGELFEGTAEMLDVFYKEGYELSICSNGRQDYIELILRTNGVDDHFSKVVGLAESKSKTEAVKELMENSKKGHAVMVGDSEHDMEAGHENGIHCIGVSFGFGDISRADHVADESKDIVCLVHSLYP